MTEIACITSWLQHLRHLFPPSEVILVGAGAGTSQWIHLLQNWDVPKATLVEADDAQFQQLERSVDQLGGWRLCKQVLSAQAETVTYHQASNSAESGLLDPESLRNLWPNIKTREKQARQAITLAELQQESDMPANWLIVDCLPALSILQGALSQLHSFDVIAVRILANGSCCPTTMAGQGELEIYLKDHGYRCMATEFGRHPAIGHALFVRDTQASIHSLRERLIEKEKKYSNEVDRLLQSKAEAEMLAAKGQQRLKEAEEAKALLSEQLELTRAQLDIAINQAKASNLEVQHLLAVNAECEKHNALALNDKLDALMNEQRSQANKIQRGLSEEVAKSLGNAVKQIEAFIGIQNYLERGEIPMNFHGWPVSPDIALFLLSKFEAENYDLIIEFGSGTSTLLFAKALKNKMQRLGSRSHNKEPIFCSSAEVTPIDVKTEANTMSKRIISFEHNKLYYDRTYALLSEENLDNLVDLVHAPLVEYQYKGNDQLYYACTQTLDQLAATLGGRVAKILVLVDGPPGLLGPRARFPALPHLLNKLGEHQIDIVLDDYNRKEEKEIVESWKAIIRERSIPYSEEDVLCEKGAFFCRLN